MKIRRLFSLLSILSVLAGTQEVSAKTFKTQFIRFELPPNWSCAQEELDWVCQPDNLAERSEAIIIVVTKAVNEVDDNMGKYEQVLKTPRDMRDLVGNSYKSEVRYVRQQTVRDHPWMDSLTLGSEMPGFFTRYLASTKENKVAGLISYSIAESVYPKWAPILDAMVNTVEMTWDPKAFAELMAQSGTGSLLGSRGGARGRFAPKDEDDKKKGGPGGMDLGMLGGIALVAAAGGYLYYKKKKKKS